MKYAIVGSGFTGAVMAHKLAKNGIEVDVFESRNHIGGNCYTERDKDTGVLIHKYGPHIFHTDNEVVWEFINQFSEFKPFTNRVKTTVGEEVFSLPINLHTINQFYKKTFSPKEAKNHINDISDKSIEKPINFEDQALKFVGKDLYEAFFKGYTQKQWGRSPTSLPASILKRLPVRFNYDDNYFNHKFQGMPIDGYTKIFEKLLDHSNINLYLNRTFKRNDKENYQHTFFSGPIDSWFNHEIGRLAYRTLDFEKEEHEGDFQGCAVMNYGDESVPFTRITEHKYFEPWTDNSKTIIFKEYSREATEKDIPYYPIRQTDEKEMLRQYIELANSEKKVSFMGRLGTYRYLDMDVTISEALSAYDDVKRLLKQNKELPVFYTNPI